MLGLHAFLRYSQEHRVGAGWGEPSRRANSLCNLPGESGERYNDGNFHSLTLFPRFYMAPNTFLLTSSLYPAAILPVFTFQGKKIKCMNI